MILSIIIVNFNVKYFLEQCLHSVKKALSGSALLPETEVFIVDNSSTDGSLDFLAPLYPGFHFIPNSQNTGFAKANNQVLSRCSGEYILFLNPDTLVAEDSLDSCLSFFQKHPNAGAAGVRMIDGSGHFLKESKRGFPTARASFFKITGLAACFPSSRLFAAYYAGHLDSRTSHPVDILSGAFLMVRKEVLDKTGGFDEQFFMYAEDIDLSYRIKKAGFQNYYLASTSIIHFKGESTRRDIRYVDQFHLAMNQFMKKYFHGSFPAPLLFLLKLGIGFKRRITALMLGFQKEAVRVKQRGPVFIKGDPGHFQAAGDALRNAGIAVTRAEAEAGAILYCESGQASLKSIIQEMDKETKKRSCYIHGSGTQAAVGSSSGREKGTIIPW
jgi:GT2 family glycosyltransferase